MSPTGKPSEDGQKNAGNRDGSGDKTGRKWSHARQQASADRTRGRRRTRRPAASLWDPIPGQLPLFEGPGQLALFGTDPGASGDDGGEVPR